MSDDATRADDLRSNSEHSSPEETDSPGETTILDADRGITVKFDSERRMWELSVAPEINFLSREHAVIYYRRHFNTHTGDGKIKSPSQATPKGQA